MQKALAIAALIFSAGCAPALVSVRAPALPPLPPVAACAEFAFPEPRPIPVLPDIHASRCAGYAACFDETEAAALHLKLNLLRADDIYMRAFYKDEVAAYRHMINSGEGEK
jgi:hypothetical protein